MTCPECGAQTRIFDGVITYHIRPDNLSACARSKTRPDTEQPEVEKPKKAPAKKAPAKKATRTKA